MAADWVVSTVSALAGAVVGAALPAWWQHRTATVSALEVLETELETNLALLRADGDAWRARQREVAFGVAVTRPLELHVIGFESSAAAMAGLKPATRRHVLLAYAVIRMLSKSIQRHLESAQGLHQRVTGAMLNVQREAKLVRALDTQADKYIEVALTHLRAELREFRESNRLW